MTIFGKTKLFPSLKDLFRVPPKPEIILTKEEAKVWKIDLKKNPKGVYIKIQGVRVPVNIKD
ncbi:MAG: hypothetical protein KKF50_00360 [Nanoarchaeota archaeon]|nr:hypothetical protein [Nanoarchaeota archaeon]